MTANWRTVRVFISSTFRDMYAERDHLVKVVFPELRERLHRRRVHLIDVDLRWGVTREQAENNLAIDFCLEQVSGCDVFLALLGQRYGYSPTEHSPRLLERYPWVADHPGKSVTELEILSANGKPCLFFFRAPMGSESLPTDYLETESQRVRYLEELKQRIESANAVTTYAPRWEAGRLVGLDEFGRRVTDGLWEVLQGQLREVSPREVDEDEDLHERFMESRLRVHVERRQLHHDLLQHVESNAAMAAIVLASPGSGKSAALAHFVTEYRRTHPHTFVVAHFVGAGPRSANPRDVLSHFCRRLNDRFHLGAELPEETHKLSATCAKLLTKIPPRNRVLLVLDGLNQLDEAERAHHLEWLPTHFPTHVKVLLSSTEADVDRSTLAAALARRPLQIVRVPPLLEEERRAILRDVPSLSAKALDDEQVAALLDNPATTNPLYLLVSLEELRGFGTHDKLTERIRSLPRGEDAITLLFGQVLERLEADFGAPLVSDVLSSLAASRRGLTEPELVRLLKDSPRADNLFPLLRQLRPYLLERGALLDYYHRNLFKSVRSRYLRDPARFREVYARLSRFFLAEPNGPRKADELPRLLARAEQWEDLGRLLMDGPFLESKAAAGLLVDLVGDVQVVSEHLPEGHPQRVHLELLEEVLRTDLHFLTQYPECLFQCCWNRIWWYDCAVRGTYEATARPALSGLSACAWIETWASQRGVQPWLKMRRPPETALGGPQLAVLAGHRDSVATVAFAPDGERLASGGDDGNVRIWDCSTGQEILCLKGHKDRVWCVTWTSDGQRLVSGSWDRSVRVWNAHDGSEVHLLRGPRERVWSVAVSPDGHWIAAGSDDERLQVWDAATGEKFVRQRDLGTAIWSVAFSPDGDTLATGSSDHRIRLWRRSDLTVLATWEGHEAEVMSLRFSRDGRNVVSAGADHTVRLWEVRGGRLLHTFKGHHGWVGGAAYTADERAVLSASWDRTVRVWDLESRREAQRFHGHEGVVWGVAASPKGDEIASASGDGTVRVWSLARKATTVPLIGHTDLVEGLAFSPDGRLLATASRDGTIRLWDGDDGRPLSVWSEHEGTVRAVEFTPDGRHLVSVGDDRTVSVWSTVMGEVVNVIRGHRGAVWELALSSDGLTAVTGSDDRTVRLWDLASGLESGELHGHSRWICAVAISADGDLVASAAGDNTLRVWDRERRVELARVEWPRVTVTRLAFAPDGETLFCGTTEPALRTWNWKTGATAVLAKGLFDVTPHAAGAARYPFVCAALQSSTEVRRADDLTTVARIPTVLKNLTSHPSGRSWAGTFHSNLYLFELADAGAETTTTVSERYKS